MFLSLLLLANTSSWSYIVNDVNDDFDVVWSFDLGGGTVLDAEVTFDVTSISTDQLVMDLVISNNSTLGGISNAGLSSFGFNITPDPSSLGLVSGSIFDSAGLQQNLPSIDNNIDVCTWAANNCSGGAQPKLLAAGASDSLTLVLNFLNNPLAEYDLDLFGVKFQTDLGSYELVGCIEGDLNCTTTKVGEPGAIVLIVMGLVSLGVIRRRDNN
jgi:hypothetical protein